MPYLLMLCPYSADGRQVLVDQVRGIERITVVSLFRESELLGDFLVDFKSAEYTTSDERFNQLAKKWGLKKVDKFTHYDWW